MLLLLLLPQVACLVATEILALVGLRSFKTAALLLVGLLVYDVFWVFGSPSGESCCVASSFCGHHMLSMTHRLCGTVSYSVPKHCFTTFLHTTLFACFVYCL